MRLKTPDARVVHMKINTKNSTLSCDKIVQARAIYWPLFVLDLKKGGNMLVQSEQANEINLSR